MSVPLARAFACPAVGSPAAAKPQDRHCLLLREEAESAAVLVGQCSDFAYRPADRFVAASCRSAVADTALAEAVREDLLAGVSARGSVCC